MKPIVEKVLSSGLIDKHMAQMLERWGNLPEGASELCRDDALKDATKEQLLRLAEELGDEVDKQRTLKETQLDLDRIRWPTEVSIMSVGGPNREQIAYRVPAVIDRMGRYYFRIQDVKDIWFVPGYLLCRDVPRKDGSGLQMLEEQILEKTVLYVDDQPVCIQVSVR